MSECTANTCYCGADPPCWQKPPNNAAFLRECERRAGATREEMLKLCRDYSTHAYNCPKRRSEARCACGVDLAGALRRILTGAE